MDRCSLWNDFCRGEWNTHIIVLPKTHEITKAGYVQYIYFDKRLTESEGLGLPPAMIKQDGRNFIFNYVIYSPRLAKMVEEMAEVLNDGTFEPGRKLDQEPIILDN